MDRDLEGHTALVTGAGRNIGRAIVLELAAKGAGVVINARSNTEEAEAVAAEARALGAESLTVMGDMAKPETIEALQERSTERFGTVDIVVSNAAVRPHQNFLDITIDDWMNILDTQLNASFRLAQTFVPGMIEQQWGRIIHITGPDAFIGMPNRAHNVTAKGGLRALTKALAVELGPYGITVNDVAPGAIDTIRNELSHPRRSTGSFDASAPRSSAIPRIPVGRLGTPEDLAYACGFLASPRAGFYTGNVMACFGGQWVVD